MKRYSIEWAGTITRDIGWIEVEANSPQESCEKFLAEHGRTKMVRAISEIVSDL